MRIAVAQLGARRHYAVPRIFHEAGMLERLYTDSYVGNKPWLERAFCLMPASLRSDGVSRLLGRRDERIPPHKVTSFDAFGLRYARARQRARGTAELAGIYADFARRFCKRIVARRPDGDAVWAFDGAALELFRWAKARGIRCVLEQTLAPRQVVSRLLAEEAERWPGWQPGLQVPSGLDPLAEREEEEWALADRIVTGLSFVVDSISQCGGPAHKCAVVPYGVDTVRFASAAPHHRALLRTQTARPLRGRGRAAQGRALPAGGATPTWSREGRGAPCRTPCAVVREARALQGRRRLPWPDPPLKNAGALPMGRRARHAFPFRDSGPLVVCEALAAGVYVITTPNARSVLSDASAFGEIVPIRSVEAIAAALRRRRELGPAARSDGRCIPPVSLGDYRDRLLNAARGVL